MDITIKLVDDLSKLYVMVDNNDMDEVIEKLKKIFGVVGLNPSARISSKDEEIKAKSARSGKLCL